MIVIPIGDSPLLVNVAIALAELIPGGEAEEIEEAFGTV